jgi:hypothetical protein
MSEKNAKADRAAEMVLVNKETLGRLNMERALFRCLLGLMIFEVNQGMGENWRAVFSPNLIELGKTFDLKVSTAADGALPSDLLALAREHLKIELPPAMNEIDIGMIKSLIPVEVLKKTFVISVALREGEAEKIAEAEAEHKKRIAQMQEDAEVELIKRSTIGAIDEEAVRERIRDRAGSVHQEDPRPSEPQEPEARAPRSRSKYCATCHEIYDTTEGEPHTCTPIIH